MSKIPFITLKQFLDEALDREFRGNRDDGYDLHKSFGPHHMHVGLTHKMYHPISQVEYPKHEKHYEFEFTSDGNFGHKDDSGIPIGTRAAMGHYAGKALHHFIKHHQPDSIQFSAYNKQHAHHFAMMAHAMATATGYHHEQETEERRYGPDKTTHFLHRK